MFVNKYPLTGAMKVDDDYVDLPALTAMTIESMGGDYLQLKTVRGMGETFISVSANIFAVGFERIDQLD